MRARELEQQNSQLQILVNNLATENTDLRHRIQMTERKLVELEKLVKEVLGNYNSGAQKQFKYTSYIQM